MMLFWRMYWKLWTDFTHCFRVSIVNFEEVTATWEEAKSFRIQKNLKQYFSLVLQTGLPLEFSYRSHNPI